MDVEGAERREEVEQAGRNEVAERGGDEQVGRGVCVEWRRSLSYRESARIARRVAARNATSSFTVNALIPPSGRTATGRPISSARVRRGAEANETRCIRIQARPRVSSSRVSQVMLLTDAAGPPSNPGMCVYLARRGREAPAQGLSVPEGVACLSVGRLSGPPADTARPAFALLRQRVQRRC